MNITERFAKLELEVEDLRELIKEEGEGEWADYMKSTPISGQVINELGEDLIMKGNHGGGKG